MRSVRDPLPCETRHCNYEPHPHLISTSACAMLLTCAEPKLGSVGAISGSRWAMPLRHIVVQLQWKHFIITPGPGVGNLETSQQQHTARALFTCQVQGVCAHKRRQVVAEPLKKVFVQDLGRVVPEQKHSLLANSRWISFTDREWKPDNRRAKSWGTRAPSDS